MSLTFYIRSAIVHFTDEETESGRNKVICSGLHLA
jgi:hypothetical protein